MTVAPAPSQPFAGRGSTGNVLAALASVLCPGLGQLVQGRLLAALGFFLASFGLLPLCGLGLVFYVWGIVNAARWRAVG